MRSSFTVPRAGQRRSARPTRTLTDRQIAALRFIGADRAIAAHAGQMTRCIAYMCPWAHACDTATRLPAAVEERACHRKRAEALRPEAGLSEHSVDVLAEHRRSGRPLGGPTVAMLDRRRPHGPSRNLGARRPAYPVAVG